MTVRITIELDDVPAPLAAEIARAFDRLSGESGSNGAETARESSWWLGQGRIETLLTQLTDGALIALEAIARTAPEASIEAVQAQVRKTEPRAGDVNVFGGILSSFGHAKNRMGAPSRIFEVDDHRRVYVIDESVASAVLSALSRMRKPADEH